MKNWSGSPVDCTSFDPTASRAPKSACTPSLLPPDVCDIEWERSFIDAQVAIRKTSREFQTELVVTRTYGEGESDLVQEDDESAFPSLLFLPPLP